MSNQKRIKVTIDPKGNYQLEALEGFSGQSCTEATKHIEVALGGLEVDEGKKDAYYDPTDYEPVKVEGL